LEQRRPLDMFVKVHFALCEGVMLLVRESCPL